MHEISILGFIHFLDYAFFLIKEKDPSLGLDLTQNMKTVYIHGLLQEREKRFHGESLIIEGTYCTKIEGKTKYADRK